MTKTATTPLAVLVPRPRVNLTRYHGVFASNSAHRSQVTPARRGRGCTPKAPGTGPTPDERHAAMTWAQRRKRVFNIDIQTCTPVPTDGHPPKTTRAGDDSKNSVKPIAVK